MLSRWLGIQRTVFDVDNNNFYLFFENIRHIFLDLTAGPFEWGPIIGGEGVRSKASVPRVPHKPSWKDATLVEYEEEEKASLAVEMERYRSESTFLEAYWSQNCQTSDGEAQETTSLCADLAKQLTSVRAAIASLEAQGTTTYTPTFLVGGSHEGANATQISDDFMSQLGAVVSNAELRGQLL